MMNLVNIYFLLLDGNKCLPNLSRVCDVSLLKNLPFLLVGFSSFFAMAALYVPFTYIADCAMSDVSTLKNNHLVIFFICNINFINKKKCFVNKYCMENYKIICI